MRPLNEIIKIIETNAVLQYGSVDKMLTENNINQSIVGNMKRKKPSIPNIVDFCKLADSLSLSLDYILNGNQKEIIPTTDPLSIDEKNIIDVYRAVNPIGKDLVQRNIREIWADHRQIEKDSSASSKDTSISKLSSDSKTG